MADERDIDLGVTVRGFTPGQTVFDRYVLVRLLGRGGMGMVWLARDEQLRREIALKFLPELVAADPTSIDDLKRETSRSLDLTHPHIVRVHDFITDGALAAISMEYVPGRTLAELRLQQPTRIFEASELTTWVGELCEALHYAHVDASLVHRDLKPSNLMVDARRRLKVTDFGIAATVSDTVTRVSRLTSSGGTPAYASPQQLMGEAPSPSDDIYAVGATLFELLTSKPPFFSGNLMLQVQTRLPPTVAARRAELNVAGALIPPEWEAAVAACLAKQREERPGSIMELAQRLGLNGLVSPAAPKRAGADVGFDLTVPSFPRGDRTGPPAPPVIPGGKTGAAVSADRIPPPPPPPLPPPAKPVEAKPVPVRAEPEPAPVRRSGAGRWVLVCLLLVGAGVGAWLGDGPNRVLALLDQRQGHQARVAANWTEAMQRFKAAVMRRPTDPAIQQDFETAQEQWVQHVREALAGLSPQDAYAALTPELLATGKQLTGRFADDFRELVEKSSEEVRRELRLALGRVEAQASAGDFAAAFAGLEALKSRAAEMPEYARALQRVQETEVRQEIAAAVKLADDGNYAGALANLEQAAEKSLLTAEIDEARTRVRQQATTGNVDRLGQAIRSGRAEDVQRILEASGNVQGDASAVARQLVEAKQFDAFLAALPAAGFRAMEDPKAARGTHLLTETLRDRFTDRPAVARHLAGSYAAWARELLTAQQPGFALYVLERAQMEGGTVDAELVAQARTEAARALGFTLLVPPTVQASREAPVPVDAARVAARDTIARAVGTWINLVEMRPVGERRPPLEFRTRISAVETQDRTTEKTDRARYERGAETIRNPDFEKAVAELEQAQREAVEHERQLQQMQRGGDNDVVNVFQGILSIQVRAKMDAAQRRVRDLRQQLSEMPQTIRSPIYDYEAYRIITHNVVYSASLTATLHRGTDELAPWTVFEATLPHETQEVVGNSARGVPVKQPNYPDLNEVARKLGAGLTQQVGAAPDTLLGALETATFSALDNQLAEENSSASMAADRRWALARLWRLSGLAVSQTPELERAVRTQLSLPPAAVETPPGPPAKVVSFSDSVGKAPATLPTVVTAERKGTAVAPPARAPESLVYTVRSGDSLEKVATRFDVTVAELRAANPKIDPRRLRMGQELIIPRE